MPALTLCPSRCSSPSWTVSPSPAFSAPVVRWLRTEGYTAVSSSTHPLTLPPILLPRKKAEMSDLESNHRTGIEQRNNDEPLRVLLLVHELFPGAPSVPLEAFELSKGRITLRTVALGGGFLEGRYRRLGEVDIVPAWEPPLLRRLSRRWFLWWLGRRLAKFRPQLLYVNSVVTLPLARELPLPNVPLLLHVHELESEIEPVLTVNGALLREWPGRYVAVSDAVRNVLRKTVGIPNDKIVLIHDFIRDDMLARSDRRHELNADETQRTFVVGGAGRPSWRKGMSLWLQMAAALRQVAPALRVEFCWVGMVDNAVARAARLEANKLGVDGIVKFIPLMEQPTDEYRRFNVFALTSWEDPCPLVVLETMALGKPVVCFAGGGGTPEEVGDCGVIVPEFDPQMMAAKVAELAGNSARREALGRHAQSRVQRMFVASVQAPKLLEQMRQVAAGEGRVPVKRTRFLGTRSWLG